MQNGFWRATQDSAQATQFDFNVSKDVCVGRGDDYQFYMGGAAMATHIDALERYFDKPLLWATTQYLTHGLKDDALTLDVAKVGGGRNVVQAMATMRRGDDVLHQTMAALGARGDVADRAFVSMPDVKPPLDCPFKVLEELAGSDNLMDMLERRTAYEDAEAGVEYMWVRANWVSPVDAAYLVLISDFFLGAHEMTRGGTSLDNTFRLINTPQNAQPRPWLLSVTQLSSFTRGAAQGTQHIFAEDGTLLCTSSQTGLLPQRT